MQSRTTMTPVERAMIRTPKEQALVEYAERCYALGERSMRRAFERIHDRYGRWFLRQWDPYPTGFHHHRFRADRLNGQAARAVKIIARMRRRRMDRAVAGAILGPVR